MPLSISGTLKLPMGAAAANAQIRFRAVDSFDEVIAGAEQTARCDADGRYSISIEYGRYELSTKISSVDFLTHGIVTILDSTVASDLEDLIKLIGIEGELSDDLIKEFNHLIQQATDAAAAAKESETNAAQSESNAAKSETNAGNSETNAAQSESNAADSATAAHNDAQYIKDHLHDADATAAAAKESETNAAKSESNSAASEKLAHDYAVGPNPAPPLETPSDTNNAYYYFQQVLGLTGGVIAFGNKFTPAPSKEYPDKPATSGMWVIETSDANGYTFTGGDAKGITCKTGDWLVYYKSEDKFAPLLVSPLHHDDIGAATETVAGIAEIATVDEVIAGLDDKRFITSKKLAALIQENSWKMYARGEAEMMQMIEANKNLFAASGNVDFGKHLTNTATRTSINEGLYSITEVGTENTLFSGRKGSSQQGASQSLAPVVHRAGIVSKLDFGDPNNALEIKFKEAPDGRDTFDKSTGNVVRHATVQAAFAAAGVDQNIEVLFDRHDVFGDEFWLEIVSTANPFVYLYGDVQSKAASMNGIATSRSNRPSTYYAQYEGDTSSDGLGVDFWAATPEQKIAMLSDSENNLFLVKDEFGVDVIVQWRDRIKNFTGVANGSPVDIDPEGGNVLRLAGSIRPSPQGYRDTPHVDQGASFFSASNFAQYNPRPELGCFTATTASSTGLFSHCYFTVWGGVRRLNQGCFHPSHNALGAAAFAWRDSANGQVEWHSNVKAKNPTNMEDCFKLSTDGGSKSTNPTTGKLEDAFKARDDERKYDGIYSGGDGGVNDERVTAWDMGSKEEASKVFQKVVNKTFRGEEELKFILPKTEINSTNTGAVFTSQVDDVTGIEIGNRCWIQVAGGAYEEHTISSVSPSSNTFTTVESHSRVNGSPILIEINTGSTVSGEFQMVDVFADPADILNIPELANGWQGGWAGVPGDAPDGDVDFTRKNVGVTPTRTYWNGSGWSTGVMPNYDSILNGSKRNWSSSDGYVYMFIYTAWAKMTRETSEEKKVLNGSEGVGYVFASEHYNDWTGVNLAESLMGKILTNSSADYFMGEHAVTNLNGIFGGLLTWTSSDRDAPEHTPIVMEEPNNNSPAFKTLWYQTATNQQVNLFLPFNELVWKDFPVPYPPVQADAAQTYSAGNVYRVVQGGTHGGLLIHASNTVTLQLDLYSLARNGVFYNSYTGNPTTSINVWDGNGWGDDSRIKIKYGTDTYTNLNGEVCLCGTHELSKSIGYTKNRARVGTQVPGVDLKGVIGL